MGQQYIKSPIDTIFSWLYDGPQWSERRPAPEIIEVLSNPPKKAEFNVQEALTDERAMVECLPEVANVDDAHWMVVKHYLDSSKHLMNIAADLSGDNYSAEAITADDTYFTLNDGMWERALTAVHNETQAYRKAVNQARFFNSLSAAANDNSDEEAPAAGQYEEASAAIGLLREQIEGRADEIRSALNSQGKLKSMSPNGQALCQFAAHMCDMAEIAVSEWHGTLPNPPPKREAGSDLPPMG
ncbi:MAG: hypothetical protein MRY32_04495 [Rickettsiales bacterium]|nr:hypothetical protein [Rickettsiales bacterium]